MAAFKTYPVMPPPRFWVQYCDAMSGVLPSVQAALAGSGDLSVEDALVQACAWTHQTSERSGCLHFVGNGASACFASHMALDWTKNARVRALAYNDTAFLTAISNDSGYERVFSDPVTWFGREGDLLAAISSSGNSPNVVRAIATARAQGLRVITFSGMKPDNKSRQAGDLNFYVPAWSYGIVECCHQILLHAWLDGYMGVKDWEMTKPQFT